MVARFFAKLFWQMNKQGTDDLYSLTCLVAKHTGGNIKKAPTSLNMHITP